MEENINETNVKEKRSNTKLVFILAIVGFVIEIILLFIIKSQVETFTWKTLIYWVIGGIILFGGISAGFFFVTSYLKKKENSVQEKKDTQPQPITLGEAEDLVKNIMFSSLFAQYLSTPVDVGVIETGEDIKSSIYKHIAFGKYKVNGELVKYAILINMHYPLQKRRVLINPKSDYEIEKALKGLATHPEKAPTVRKIFRKNPILGTEENIEEIGKKEDIKVNIKKEKEDLQ